MAAAVPLLRDAAHAHIVAGDTRGSAHSIHGRPGVYGALRSAYAWSEPVVHLLMLQRVHPHRRHWHVCKGSYARRSSQSASRLACVANCSHALVRHHNSFLTRTHIPRPWMFHMFVSARRPRASSRSSTALLYVVREFISLCRAATDAAVWTAAACSSILQIWLFHGQSSPFHCFITTPCRAWR